MNDYYLNVENEQAMHEALLSAGVLDEEGNTVEGVHLDVLGVRHERDGGTDEEPTYTALPGYHANVRSAEPIEWPDSVTLSDPKTPWRIWG